MDTVDEETLAVNVAARPGKHLPRPERKKPEVYGFDARDSIEDAAREKDPDILPSILLGFRAGLRSGEICALSWKDIDFNKKEITVRRTFSKKELNSPKGGSKRVLPLSPSLETAPTAYKARTAEKILKSQNQWLYPAHRGEAAKEDLPVSGDWILRRFRKCLKAAGLPATGKFHSTRHTFGSHLYAVGAPSPAVRDLMGHADLATTNIYSHMVDDVTKIVGRLERMEQHANPRKQNERDDGKI